jgi:hypothetical protein
LSEGVIDPTFVKWFRKRYKSDLAMNLEESRKKIDITHLCRMNGKDLQGF